MLRSLILIARRIRFSTSISRPPHRNISIERAVLYAFYSTQCRVADKVDVGQKILVPDGISDCLDYIPTSHIPFTSLLLLFSFLHYSNGQAVLTRFSGWLTLMM